MKINKIGVQLWTIRDHLKTLDQIKDSFKKLKEIGYDQIETAGCPISYENFGKAAKEAGLEIINTHENFDLMYNDFEKALEKQKLLGTLNMGVGGYKNETLEDYEEFIKKANIVGKKIHECGGRFSYHNHHVEFKKIGNGVIPMELLAEKLDPVNTSIELDTHWVQRGGGDVREWIKRLKGRIEILHLKDFALDENYNPVYAEIGNGNLYWQGIIDEAKKAGVKYYVVEQDVCPKDPFDSLKMSSEYLHKHFM